MPDARVYQPVPSRAEPGYSPFADIRSHRSFPAHRPSDPTVDRLHPYGVLASNRASWGNRGEGGGRLSGPGSHESPASFQRPSHYPPPVENASQRSLPPPALPSSAGRSLVPLDDLVAGRKRSAPDHWHADSSASASSARSRPRLQSEYSPTPARLDLGFQGPSPPTGYDWDRFADRGRDDRAGTWDRFSVNSDPPRHPTPLDRGSRLVAPPADFDSALAQTHSRGPPPFSPPFPAHLHPGPPHPSAYRTPVPYASDPSSRLTNPSGLSGAPAGPPGPNPEGWYTSSAASAHSQHPESRSSPTSRRRSSQQPPWMPSPSAEAQLICTTDFEMLRVSPEAVSLLGIPEHELVQRTLWDWVYESDRVHLEHMWASVTMPDGPDPTEPKPQAVSSNFSIRQVRAAFEAPFSLLTVPASGTRADSTQLRLGLRWGPQSALGPEPNAIQLVPVTMQVYLGGFFGLSVAHSASYSKAYLVVTLRRVD